MAKTKAQVGLQALQTMRVVEGDATPEANDTTVIEDAYDQIKAMLYNLHLVTWEDSAIPDDVIQPVVDLMCASRITFFDPPPNVVQIILQGASGATELLTNMLAQDYVPEVISSEPL